MKIKFTREKQENIFVFFAVFFACGVGLSLAGISLNQIALIPLELLLLCKLIKNGGVAKINKDQQLLLCYYCLLALSSVMGLFNLNQLDGYEQILIFNVLKSIFIYIPILLGVNKLQFPRETFSKIILFSLQISCVWGIAQFVLWYAIRFDFNNYFFSTLLKGYLGEGSISYINIGGVTALRATGLTLHPSVFGFFMFLGFCLSKNWRWKFLFFLASLMSVSRSSVLVIVFVFCLMQIEKIINQRKKVTMKKILYAVGAGIISVLFVFCCFQIDILRFQIDAFVSRMSWVSDIGSSSSGTMRHLLYAPLAIVILIAEFPLIYKLIGVGVRASGAALVYSEIAADWIQLNPGMTTKAWVIECDFADVLLGSGIIGAFLYYSLLFRVYKKYRKCNQGLKYVAVGMVVFGFMYNISTLVIVNLFFCFVLADGQPKQCEN